jgi:hypothetical protein
MVECPEQSFARTAVHAPDCTAATGTPGERRQGSFSGGFHCTASATRGACEERVATTFQEQARGYALVLSVQQPAALSCVRHRRAEAHPARIASNDAALGRRGSVEPQRDRRLRSSPRKLPALRPRAGIVRHLFARPRGNTGHRGTAHQRGQQPCCRIRWR